MEAVAIHNIHKTQRSSTSIRLRSGAYFDFLCPEESEFTIDDIAHSLSNICRYTGHPYEFYSVAQHSVLASQIVPPEFAFHALMHDAAEAFIGDVAKPLKRLLPDYAKIEIRVERVVMSRFGLPLEMPGCVKRADIIMLRTEQRDIMECEKEIWLQAEGEKPLSSTIIPWSPSVAKRMFLDRYSELVHA